MAEWKWYILSQFSISTSRKLPACILKATNNKKIAEKKFSNKRDSLELLNIKGWIDTETFLKKEVKKKSNWFYIYKPQDVAIRKLYKTTSLYLTRCQSANGGINPVDGPRYVKGKKNNH